ncbi:MAG TPA: hypothetical protein VNR87_13785, partial [Flavisolibacter sp.]|nr:hypothetical protein [Flavisolibacter sp.]
MDRKSFLGTASALAAGLSLPLKRSLAAAPADDELTTYKKPPYLKPGDTIGITSPAGTITIKEMQPAIS